MNPLTKSSSIFGTQSKGMLTTHVITKMIFFNLFISIKFFGQITMKLGYNELGYNELGYNEFGYNEFGYNKHSVIISKKVYSRG